MDIPTICTIERVSSNCSVESDSLWPHVLSSPWNSPDQNTGVVRLSLLQGIFPTQGSNPGLLHCRRILLLAEPQGKPDLCSYISVFLLFLLSQVSSSSTSERANNHQSENSLQNIDSKIVLGWMKLLSVIIGQKNILQKYNIHKERLKKQELLNPKKWGLKGKM